MRARPTNDDFYATAPGYQGVEHRDAPDTILHLASSSVFLERGRVCWFPLTMPRAGIVERVRAAVDLLERRLAHARAFLADLERQP